MSDVAAVLAIIAHFDELDDTAADADAVLQATARLAGCPVGARWESGTVKRYGPTGRLQLPAEPPVTDGQNPAVWLERPDTDPLDAVLLDRLRRSLRRAEATLRLGDPALLEVVLSATAHREDRARAIRLLGLDEARDTRVLAVSAHSPPEALRIITGALPGLSVRSAAIGAATAVLCQGALKTRALADDLEAVIVAAFPAPRTAGSDRGPWVGIGSAVGVFTAAASWRQALHALRFASSTGYGRRAVAYERLSALDLLADLPAERVMRNPDMARINEIAATPTGALEIATVEAFCVFGSLRRTATELHVHHSTVAARLAHVEAAMGWDLDDPMDRFMATLVLMVRRIGLSSAELTEP